MLTRSKILSELDNLLKQISVANGYSTNFKSVEAWQNTPSEYRQNQIIYRDEREKYEYKNSLYKAILRISILAIVVETGAYSPAELGNIALGDLIKAVSGLKVNKSIVNLVDSFKWIETKGITVCQVELNIDVKYQF